MPEYEKPTAEWITAADPDSYKKSQMREKCFNAAQQDLDAHGLAANSENKIKLAHAISAAMQNASLTLTRYASGDFTVNSYPSGRTGSATAHGLAAAMAATAARPR